MVIGEYIPQRGGLAWLTFPPQTGHERAGRRSAREAQFIARLDADTVEKVLERVGTLL